MKAPRLDRILTPTEAATSHQDAREAGDLLIWTITDTANTQPGPFVARPFSVRFNMELDEILTADTLEGLREALPPDLVRSDKSLNDDFNVVECWV